MNAATLPPPRIETLDVLRGIAVMGIFSVNVIGFAMPIQAYFNPSAYGGAGGADLATWALNFVLVDGKMRGLFSLLFGASMLLVIEQAEAAGRSPAGVHYRRMAWLLLFGLAHFYLVWFGDILISYAAIGMVAFLFRRLPVHSLLVAAGMALILSFVLAAGLSHHVTTTAAAAAAPGASAEALAAWQETLRHFGAPQGAALAQDLALHRGGYSGLVHHRLTELAGDPLGQILFGGPETLAFMLLGMAGLRSGFLGGRWEARRYRRIAAAALAVGMPAYALLAWLNWSSGFAPETVVTMFIGLAAPVRPVMMLGYAALFVLFALRGGWLAERIGAVGRAALTNYLGTSLVATFVFYGYGLGLYGHVGRFEAWLLAPLVWALMLAWSKPWLDRHLYGPLEWLWRSLARWRLQPMRRPAAA
jgi:uncharacterized protein